jgi:hypothetical protein
MFLLSSITVSETSTRNLTSPETLTPSDEYMSSSSIIVMPQGAPTHFSAVGNDVEDVASEQSLRQSVDSPVTAPSHSVGDDVELSDSDSITSGSLLSVSDSDSDEELWEDSRTSVIVEGRESLRAPTEAQLPDEYVILYDETASSEEE